MSPTVSGTVTDKSGNVANWSTSWTSGGGGTNLAQDLVSYRVFPHYTGKTYGDHPAVLTRLTDVGVKQINALLDPNPLPSVLNFFDSCFAAGIRVNLTVGKPRVPMTTAERTQVKTLLKGRLRGKVRRVCSWNEPNHQRSSSDPTLTNWAALTVAEQGKLWDDVQEVNADYATDGTPALLVGSCQLWSGSLTQQYSDLTQIAAGIRGKYDLIAWHLYMRPSGGVVDWTMLDDQENEYRTILDDQTSNIDCTESGFFTAPNYTGGSNPVTEPQQATLLVQLIDQYVSRGWYLNLFELLDDPDPSGANRESSFGIVRTPAIASTTWTNKPGFAAVKTRLA